MAFPCAVEVREGLFCEARDFPPEGAPSEVGDCHQEGCDDGGGEGDEFQRTSRMTGVPGIGTINGPRRDDAAAGYDQYLIPAGQQRPHRSLHQPRPGKLGESLRAVRRPWLMAAV